MSQERSLASSAAAKSASTSGSATETSRDQPSSSTSSFSAITTSPAWDATKPETRQSEMSSSACLLLTGSGTGPVPGPSPPHPAIVTAARTERMEERSLISSFDCGGCFEVPAEGSQRRVVGLAPVDEGVRVAVGGLADAHPTDEAADLGHVRPR
jgi:hypothetical protein